MLRLGEVDIALAGGVSETPNAFGVFACFKNEGALAMHEDPAKACRPFDRARNGLVVSEGGCVFVLERLPDAEKRRANIYGEVVGYHVNSDACDFVMPNAERQAECMQGALIKADIEPSDIDVVNTHATGTRSGDVEECKAIRKVFGECEGVYVNNTKGFIGHAMGAAGALELAGNLPSFRDGIVHPTINIEEIDPDCELPNLVINKPVQLPNVDYIMNNSFGMLGINTALVVMRYVN
jgi:3-oxoacyl-[acyl-carrier-protein] synthase II